MEFASLDSPADERVLAPYRPLLAQNARAIKASWLRCENAGLKCNRVPVAQQLSQAELRRCYDMSGMVRQLALTEMRLLHGHLGHRGFTLTLADPNSVILDCLPGRGLDAVGRTDLAPGNCWPEDSRGTNAVGTAATAGRLVVVAGDDHYLEAYRGLLCVATPVFAPDGAVQAVMDATVARPVDSHTLAYTLGLMHMASGHVQAELFRRQHHRDYVVLLDAADDQASLSGIALAFDRHGELTGRSAAATSALADICIEQDQVAFDELFDADFELIRAGIRPPVGFKMLVDRSGRRYQATLYMPDASVLDTHEQQIGSRARFRAGTSAADAGPDLGADERICQIQSQVGRALRHDVPILVRGETGTGKELMARHVHAVSGRSGEFVAINCAAVPEQLIESELFGHTAGAFTGARRDGAVGLVRQADGGTLFLDEIGDMPIALQARLLRLIDSWRVRPVGGEQETGVNVQLIAATHRDLEQEVALGRFRLDLLHRIKVCEVRLPALRERSDFAPLCRSLLDHIAPERSLADSAVERLAAHGWPGNIRELRNTMLRMVIASDTQRLSAIEVDAVMQDTPGEYDGQAEAPARVNIQNVLAEESGNIAATARRLGLSRTTVYKRLKQL